ncbi:MAG: folate-binding protein YgfZ [Pelagibacteraceae bacterium]|nr:folate-binding protein YgfZ [Pelagibacteraceae bacterium]
MMEENSIIILKDRDIISVSGSDSASFLQNVITNDINKLNESNSLYSALLTPQGKYLYDFFILKHEKNYLIDCESETAENLLSCFQKYKLNANIEFKNITSDNSVAIITYKKFQQIQKNDVVDIVFSDPRTNLMGARIISKLEKLNLAIKKLGLKLTDQEQYFEMAHTLGLPIKGLKKLQNQIFALELNFEEEKGVDFMKGCYIGQENTSRMKLGNKLRRRLFPLKTSNELKDGSEIFFKNEVVGKVMISKPKAFGLIKLYDPNIESFLDEDLKCNNSNVNLVKPYWFNQS